MQTNKGYIWIIMLLVMVGCATTRQTEGTIKSLKDTLHTKIQDTTRNIYEGKIYESLAFGTLKVYKPSSFKKLDSLYALKSSYLENNDYEKLRRSGIQKIIPIYRAAVKKDTSKIQYEIEHVYQIRHGDSLTVHHSFYLFNYNDSLLLITPFYQFTIPLRYERFFKAFLFHYHFMTNRNLFISKEEQNFIRFFNARKRELIHTGKLPAFMNHTFELMQFANLTHSVDFNKLSKVLMTKHLIVKYGMEHLEFEKFGQLYSYKKEGKIVYYTAKISWKNKITGEENKTKFKFTPYLNIIKATPIKGEQ